MKTFRKVIRTMTALIISAAMLLSMLPLMAFAGEKTQSAPEWAAACVISKNGEVTYYGSLYEAENNWGTGTTLKLLKDLEIDGNYVLEVSGGTEAEPMVLDLNDYGLFKPLFGNTRTTPVIYIKEGCSLRLTDSSVGRHQTTRYISLYSGTPTGVGTTIPELVNYTDGRIGVDDYYEITGGYLAGGFANSNYKEKEFPSLGSGITNAGMLIMDAGTICGNSIYCVQESIQNSGRDDVLPPQPAGGVYNNGTFVMNGGKILKNKGRRGGGVINSYKGTFIMNGGEIAGNNADFNGGGVDNWGSFTMNGGEIYNNSGTHGGGVCNNKDSYDTQVYTGTFTMNGGKIYGNSDWQGYNILNDSATLNLNGAVFVGGEADGSDAHPVNKKELGDGGRGYGYIEVKKLTHNYTYTAIGPVITATCAEADCHLPNKKATITINAPEDLFADGREKPATITGDVEEVELPEITYKKEGDDTFSGIPREVGKYTATMTMGVASASVTYTLTAKGPGTSIISSPKSTGEWDYVYYGKNNGEPVKYRVLSSNTAYYGGTEGTHSLFLDCDNVLLKKRFDDNSNVWADSELKSWLNGSDFYGNDAFFTDAEKAAIMESYATNHPLTAGNGDKDVSQQTLEIFGNYIGLTGERIFVLDAEEASTDSYGHMKEGDQSKLKIAIGENDNTDWWLRSASNEGSGYAGVVKLRSFIVGCYPKSVTEDDGGVSPAFNVALSQIVFSTKLPDTSNEYKLTLKDSGLKVTPGTVTRNGSTVTVNFSGVTGEPDRLFVVITNGSWSDSTGWSDGTEYKYCGKLKVSDAIGTQGSGTFELPKDFTLADGLNCYLVAEKISNGKATEAASSPASFVIPKTTQKVTAPTTKTGLVYNGGTQELIDQAVVTRGNNAEGSLEYSTDNINWSASLPTGKDAGEYNLTVYYKSAANADYFEYKDSAQIKARIEKALIELTDARKPSAKTGLISNGSPQELVNAPSQPLDAGESVIKYAVTDTDAAPSADKYSASIPKATDAGTYHVWYKAVGDKNHYDTEEESLTVSMAQGEEGKKEEGPGRVPVTGAGETYAAPDDNFAPITSSGKINKLVLDFTNVDRSGINPESLKMTVIYGSRFNTKIKLKDKRSFTAGKGIKVKVNKKSLIPTITCKKSGSVTLTLEDDKTYTIEFRVQKPKAQKSAKKLAKGSGAVTKTVRDLFGTDIDSGELNILKQKHSQATLSGNSLYVNPAEKDRIKILYKYLNKKYKLTMKVK